MASSFFDIFRSTSDRPPVFSPPRRTQFSDTLSSTMPGASFTATFTADWQPLDNQPDRAESLLRWSLLHAAQRITSEREVTQRTKVEAELNYRLSGLDLSQSRARLVGCMIALVVSPEAERAAAQADQLRRDLVVEELRQQVELSQVRYLREQVLSDPATARCYWFKNHPNSLDALLDDRFEQVAAKLRATDDAATPVIADIVRQFLGGLSDDERRYLLARLGDVFVSFDRADLAGRVLGEGFLGSEAGPTAVEAHG